MFAWLIANLGTIILILVIAAIVGLIIFNMVKNKKRGKSSCGCNCCNCPNSDSCHGH